MVCKHYIVLEIGLHDRDSAGKQSCLYICMGVDEAFQVLEPRTVPLESQS